MPLEPEEFIPYDQNNANRVEFKKVPLGDRLPDSSNESDSSETEDYIMGKKKYERKSSINMPVHFTEAIIKRLSTGGIRPDQALVMAQEAECQKRMEGLDTEILGNGRVA